jgi:VIT1/CCC1 family predicted Fe2+/Mn2+ transporter
MDDRELIRRIVEEVKDEKLREELLGLVVEKNRKEDNTKGGAAKQGKEQPIDYVAKQAILFGATEGVSKVGWWIMYIISIVFILVGGFFSLILLVGILGYFLLPAEERTEVPDLTLAVLLSFLFIFGLTWFFSLRSGRKEYKRFKRKRED